MAIWLRNNPNEFTSESARLSLKIANGIVHMWVGMNGETWEAIVGPYRVENIADCDTAKMIAASVARGLLRQALAEIELLER